ncbi:LysR family transcriptional regulator [Salinicola rhizosphaerae]|uniref:LysR family transcriptional regulator n=1 Tax=Salinicola rhizosphaerae TaxID=1443141 RepID=A0ABQ3E9Y8_9GAMM|nr:LysR family transcriptional regulator [Salinicola rhizosphaerae]GHB25745.1 LysR family transcriptional regulator [Salinicola rhizosphaerae]
MNRQRLSLARLERRKLNIRHFEAFYAVGMLGSVSSAAESMNLTQPAVSKQLAALEHETGQQLFHRRSGRLEMTREAAYLFEEVSSTLVNLDGLTDAIANIRRASLGRIEIGCTPGLSYDLLPQTLSSFLRERPDVRVSLQVETSDHLLKKVLLQQLDLAVIEDSFQHPIASSPNYHAIPFNVTCVCAVSVEDPLSRKSVLTPADLDGRPAITLESGHEITVQQQRAFDIAGAVFNPAYETRLWWSGLGMVKYNLGYAIVDPFNADAYASLDAERTIRFLPFEPGLLHGMALIYPALKNIPRAAELLIAELRERVAG